VYDSRFSTENDDWDDDEWGECECEDGECEWEDEEEDDFLEGVVEVKSLVKWLYQNDYDELAFELSRMFSSQTSVTWEDVSECESDIDFLKRIAEELYK